MSLSPSPTPGIIGRVHHTTPLNAVGGVSNPNAIPVSQLREIHNLARMWKLKQSILGGDEEEREDGLLDGNFDGVCALSPVQRLYGFAACLVAGLVCMFLSLLLFAKPVKFAILFTFGNLLAVGSTAFLIGPAQQLQRMFDPVRIYATALYLGCVVLALICSLWIRSEILTILAMMCEICALIWYSLSYIPFARRVVSDIMIRLFDTEI